MERKQSPRRVHKHLLLSSSDEEAEAAICSSSNTEDMIVGEEDWRCIVKKLDQKWHRRLRKKGKAERIGKRNVDVWSVEDLRVLWESQGHTIYKHERCGEVQVHSSYRSCLFFNDSVFGLFPGIYETKCLQLGLTVNSKVLHNLVNSKCDLSGCSLGPKGCQAVAAALETHKTMVELNLSDNQIDGKVRSISFTFEAS